MALQRFPFAMLAAIGLMGTIAGCSGTTTTTPETKTRRIEVEAPPAEPNRKVHVDAGNGRGVHVDVEKPNGERSVDVNVPPRRPEVEVNP